MSVPAFKVATQAQELGLSPSRWFSVSTQWQRRPFYLLWSRLCAFDSCALIPGALLLSFLTMGSCWGRWGRSPGGLAAESNSFTLYFWLCAKRWPRPLSGAYMTMLAGGGQATVRCCISLVPPSFALCVRFHWSCQGFTLFSCPLLCVCMCVSVSICVCVCAGGKARSREGKRDRYMARRKCKHCTNPELIISQ